MSQTDLLAEAWRRDGARVLAVLARRFGDLDLAEEALADALSLAAERWPGAPPANPAGWLYKVARNRALDGARRRSKTDMLTERAMIAEPDADTGPGGMLEAELGLYFLCAHPSLSPDSQAMLMLRLCAGLPVERIAAAFTVDADAVTRRLTRAKAKIKAAKLPFETPPLSAWAERLPPVLATIEIIYDQHYADAGGGTETKALAREAEGMATALAARLNDQPEVLALLALIHFAESRRAARLGEDGAMVPLSDQDTRLWDRARIADGAALLERAASQRAPGSYQIRALIHALHTRRLDQGETPWRDILELYDALYALTGSAYVRVNRAMVLAEVQGTASALEAIEAALADNPKLLAWQPFHAARAECLSRLGRQDEAMTAFQKAIEGCRGHAERRYLMRRAAGQG